MTNPFNGQSPLAFGIASGARAVTPNDTVDLAQPGTLYIEGAGTLSVICWNGEAWAGSVPDWHETGFAVRRVLATGTTATGISVQVMP